MITAVYRFVFILSLPVLLGLVGCDRQPDPEQGRRNLHLPKAGYVGEEAKGSALYTRYCASCHGRGGYGSEQGPPLVHKTYRPAHHHDLAFHLAVKNGVKQHHWHFGHMPPIPGVTPEGTSDIVAYVRKQQRQAGVE